jgi:hypothetical protein
MQRDSLFIWLYCSCLTHSHLPASSHPSANAAIGIYSAVASGMIALTGIVFHSLS